EYWTPPVDNQTLSLPLGNSAPAAWPVRQDSVFSWRRHYSTPGHTADRLLYNGVDTPVGGALAPIVSPIQNAMIQGGDLDHDKFGVTTTPSLQWTAPELGSPIGYEIDVILWNGNTPEVIANIYTTETSLDVPPGILDADKVYTFEIIALVGNDLA